MNVKRAIALLLTVVMMLGMMTGLTSAADTEDEALGEIQIYNGGDSLNCLAVNGRVQKLNYVYYKYPSDQGIKEIPAYCVNPTDAGVPQKVPAGQSIKYIAEERTADPKVMGIVANGYPNKSLGELGLNSKVEGYYATKIALWCYIIPGWSIDRVTINPSLSGSARQQAERVLAAAKKTYKNGIWWNEVPTVGLTAVPDKEYAYPVTVDGKEYKQQIMTVNSETWVCDYTVNVAFADPGAVPAGTRIVDMNNQDITSIKTTNTGKGYKGQFKILYPADSVDGKTGSVQFTLRAKVYQYAIYYASCAEVNEYGKVQNYICDTDPVRMTGVSAISKYANEDQPEKPEEPHEGDTNLKIIKVESGTGTCLEGAVFEIKGPDGDVIGSFSTNSRGEILLPVQDEGTYVVTEIKAPLNHLIAEHPTQTVTVKYGKTATVTFEDAPYGNLRVEKVSDTGEGLEGVLVQIKHIDSGAVYSQKTATGGSANFTGLLPGAYEVREMAGIKGWEPDTVNVKTASVVTGETVTVTLKNKELPGLKIIKYDRTTMTAMPDVTFEVFKDTVSIGQYKTNQLGEIFLPELEPGTYRVEERSTGDSSHILDTTPQEIELKAGEGIRELVFFNSQKPGIHLIKVDSADLSKPIANARFKFEAVDGSWGPKEFTTDEHGEIDLAELPAGAYVVTELECPGYVIDDAQRIIQLVADQTAQFVFTNSIRPTIHIIKMSSDGSPLAGVAFRIAKIEDGSHYLDRTTNAQGEIVISDMEPGVYSVKETATTADHILDLREYHVELFPGKISTLVIENQKRPNLIVYKHDADTGEPIKDTVFLVRAADGHSVDEIRTDENGRAELTNLLPGVYEIHEKSVPDEYLKDAPDQTATLWPNRDHTVYFENHMKPGLTVHKVCSVTGDPLKGAKFQVTFASSHTSEGTIRDLGTFYTDEDGQFRIDGLEDGWYKITEVESVPGYAIKDPASQEVYIKGGESKSVTFENTPLSALVVFKYDSVTGEAVPNAVFQLKYLTGVSGTGGNVIGTYKTSLNGSFTVTNLKQGTYIVEELASDSGHVIDTSPKTVYISGKEQDVIEVYFGNSPKGSLLVKKIDSVTKEPLADVEFLVTRSDGSVVGDANGKFKTDSKGTFLIDDVNPGTTLVVKETRARDGYLLDDAPQTAKIQAGQTVTLEFRNQPKGGLIVRKLDSVTHAPLEGVEFKITYADGKNVDIRNGQLSSNGLYHTDKQGEIRLDSVTGTIVVTEVKTIPGYTIDEETRSQTVVVNPSDTQTLIFYNQPVTGVEIIKVDAANHSKRIPDAEFEIRRTDDALVTTVTTGANGVVIVPLQDGSYYATEIRPARGYKLDSTPHYFEVKDGKAEPVVVENKAMSGILIHKIDAATRKGIYGVTFLLYDSGRNPIGQYTSDDRGYVYIEELDSGRYYLRELENEGYIRDEQVKTVYVRSGETTEVTWENRSINGQIQIVKRSADYNPTNGLPEGTLLEGAVFEICDKAGNVVDTIRSNNRGLAVSRPLPLSRYTIREVKAPANYGVSEQEITAYLEYEGQIARFEVTDKSLVTGVSIKKAGPKEIMQGQPVRYTFYGIANTSNVRLDSFYWRDTIPAEVRLDKVVTGTYNRPGNYKITYRVNGGEPLTLADNLSTSKNYVVDASPTALGLAANERVTEIMFVFGQAPGGFAQVEKPYIYTTAVTRLAAKAFVNISDAGGVYNGQWVQAVSRWVTNVYGTPGIPTLPRTGY